MIYRSYNAFAPTTDEHAAIMDNMFDRYSIGQIIDMRFFDVSCGYAELSYCSLFS